MAWGKIDKFLDMMDLKNHTERLYSSLNREALITDEVSIRLKPIA